MYERFFGLEDRAVPADAGPALPLPVQEARGRAGAPEARPHRERLRLHHGRRRHRQDDAAALLPREPRRPTSRRPTSSTPPSRALELLQTINAEFGLPATSTSKKTLVDLAERAPARAPPGGSARRGRDRRGAGARHRRARAAPSALEPGDADREAPAHHPRRPAAAPRPAPPSRARAAEPAHHAALAHRPAQSRARRSPTSAIGSRSRATGRPAPSSRGRAALADSSVLGRRPAADQHARASRAARGVRRRAPPRDGP